MSERTYTEREIAFILERAARRQERASSGDVALGSGLTLEELEQVAVGAGIAPEHIAAAAAELPVGPAAKRATFLGLRAEITRSRVLPGTVSEEAWGTLVAHLRRTFKATGVVSEVGRVRSWASAASDNELPVRVLLEPEDGRVRLTLAQNPGDLVSVLTALPMGLLTLLGTLALLSDLGGAWIGGGAIFAACAIYLVVRFGYGRSVLQLEAQFEATLDRAEALVREGGAEGGGERAVAATPERGPASARAEVSRPDSPRLALPDDEADAPQAEGPTAADRLRARS